MYQWNYNNNLTIVNELLQEYVFYDKSKEKNSRIKATKI